MPKEGYYGARLISNPNDLGTSENLPNKEKHMLKLLFALIIISVIQTLALYGFSLLSNLF